MNKSKHSGSYWRDNLRVVTLLMLIWFAVGYGCGVFGISWLNQFKIGQLGLGFWIAQQGSIFVFVIIVIVYALWMDRIDRKHGLGGDR
jgi:putative solute:sodium symporter small subunit